MDIVDRLLEDALDHDDVARQCDCAPEHTVNHQHALNAREAANEIDRLRKAIQQTLDENGHLADGDNCTLIVLKRALLPNKPS